MENVKRLSKNSAIINKYFRRITGIFWPDTVSNTNLWEKTEQPKIEDELGTRKWLWLGLILSEEPSNIFMKTLTWNPKAKEQEEDPRTMEKRAGDKRRRQSARLLFLVYLAHRRERFVMTS